MTIPTYSSSNIFSCEQQQLQQEIPVTDQGSQDNIKSLTVPSSKFLARFSSNCSAQQSVNSKLNSEDKQSSSMSQVTPPSVKLTKDLPHATYWPPPLEDPGQDLAEITRCYFDEQHNQGLPPWLYFLQGISHEFRRIAASFPELWDFERMDPAKRVAFVREVSALLMEHPKPDLHTEVQRPQMISAEDKHVQRAQPQIAAEIVARVKMSLQPWNVLAHRHRQHKAWMAQPASHDPGARESPGSIARQA